MDFKGEWKKLLIIAGLFLACFYLPVGAPRFDSAVMESLQLVKWYAREHVLLCLVPAFFIAGAIGVFVSQASVMKYLGAGANKVLAYGVASVSGTVLAVCSCTVLPLFAGIYKMGAGLGPATAFLYSGPAINVLAIILTARILGLEIGDRPGGRRGRLQHRHRPADAPDLSQGGSRPSGPARWPCPSPRSNGRCGRTPSTSRSMVGILVFANWARSGDVRAIFLCCPGGLTTYKVEGTLVSKTEETVTILDTRGKTQELPAGSCRAWRRFGRTASTNGSIGCAGHWCWACWQPSS